VCVISEHVMPNKEAFKYVKSWNVFSKKKLLAICGNVNFIAFSFPGKNVPQFSPPLCEIQRLYAMTQINNQMDKAKQLTSLTLNDPNISKEDKK
jgi:hypothetical protein